MPHRPEDDAWRLLGEVWWPRPSLDYIPVDPVQIAYRLQITVFTVEMEPTVSGAIENFMGTDPVIYLNERDSKNRQRFTCAHELGHYRKRVADGDRSFEFVDRRDTLASEGTNPEEIYANQFAAALLMPADLLRQMHRTEPDPTILAYRFSVSADAMNYRLKALDLRRPSPASG